jgi:hypothetical protein
MKNIKISAVLTVIFLTLATVAFAVGNFNSKTAAQRSCCQTGAACCRNADSCCKTRNKAAEKAAFLIQDQTSDASTTNKKDCCGTNAACCKGGGTCCFKNKIAAQS